MEKARKRIRVEMKKQKERMKIRYDEGRKESDYRVGDLVWLRNKEVEIGQHHKMARKWNGPFRIVVIREDNTSVVEIHNVWNWQDEWNVNIVLLKKAFVREGQIIPQDVEQPEEMEEVIRREGADEKKEEERKR